MRSRYRTANKIEIKIHFWAILRIIRGYLKIRYWSLIRDIWLIMKNANGWMHYVNLFANGLNGLKRDPRKDLEKPWPLFHFYDESSSLTLYTLEVKFYHNIIYTMQHIRYTEKNIY